MDTMVNEMREILVVGSQLRKQWLEIFRREFLGRTNAAEATYIQNEEDIFFAQSNDPNQISAFTDVPLIIENRALGYRIYFELLSFTYQKTTGKSSFLGYNRFEELAEDEAAMEKYNIPRLTAYKGSSMHFFKSLKSNQLRQEGFSIRGVQQAATSRRSGPKGNASQKGPDIFLPGKTYAADRKSILFLDTASQQHYLNWKDALKVTYLPASEIPIGQNQTGQALRGQDTYLFIVSPPVYILENGLPANPQSVRFGGVWQTERVANMLPLDYIPRRKSVLDKKRP
jgi:hypothetical protein